MVSLQPHVGAYVFPICELATSGLPDLHDGTLGDCEDGLRCPSGEYYDLTPDSGGVRASKLDADRDQADLTHRSYPAWNHSTQRTYFAAARIDDVYVNTYPFPEYVHTVPEGMDVIIHSMRWHDHVEFAIAPWDDASMFVDALL